MIVPETLQQAWIAYLKSIPATITPVPVVEVREYKWKGDIFTYPNIRVRVVEVRPNMSNECASSTGQAIIYIFSEQKSSQEANEIAGNLASFLHGKKFTSLGMKFSATIVERIIGADSENDLFWVAEVHIRTLNN